MTTIVYDHSEGIIAYDSRVTVGDLIATDDYEKKIEAGGKLFFLAGDVSDNHKLIKNWESPEDLEESETLCFVVDEDCLWYAYSSEDNGLCRIPLDYSYAIGSGRDFALAALDLGYSAKEAVEAAAKRDLGTGGKIRTYKLKRS